MEPGCRSRPLGAPPNEYVLFRAVNKFPLSPEIVLRIGCEEPTEARQKENLLYGRVTYMEVPVCVVYS